MEFVANYVKKVHQKRIERVNRKTQAHLGYQVYDARRAVDAERNKLFGGGKAQIADHSVGEMSVRLGGLWRQGRSICGVRVTTVGASPGQEARTGLHRVHLARLRITAQQNGKRFALINEKFIRVDHAPRRCPTPVSASPTARGQDTGSALQE
jgi:hypothetical protein